MAESAQEEDARIEVASSVEEEFMEPEIQALYENLDEEEMRGMYVDDDSLWDDLYSQMFFDEPPMQITTDLLNAMSLGGEKKPNYPCGPEVTEECLICFDTLKLRRRLCCDFPACGTCMETYLVCEVQRGNVKIKCISGSCDSYVHRDEILGRLPLEMKDKYYRFLVDANKDPNMKTCPRCCRVTAVEPSERTQMKDKFGFQVVCPECSLTWCFDCQAPWHTEVSCREFRKGDKLLKNWARENHYGNQNAQRCPKCKIFIERKGGCDHMVCAKCNANFCYRCGERYCDLKFLGNHMSRFSPFGCKYNYKPNSPVTRRFVRGSVFGAKMLGGVVLLGLGLAAGAVLIGASVVILPAFGGYKYHKYRQMKKHHKRMQALFRTKVAVTTKRSMMESIRERQEMQRVNQGPVNDFLRLGLQAGESQQVQVMVHHPEPKDTSQLDQSVNSEIRMNIRDDKGRLTITTAEISNGEGEGSEVVLHVKTYDSQGEENSGAVTLSDEETDHSDVVLETLHAEDDRYDKHLPEGPGNVDISKLGTPGPSGLLPDLAMESQITGPQRSQRSSQSSEEERVDGTLTDPDDIDESMTQTGCFLKLFSKKLNTLQSQLDKEKSVPPIKLDQKERDMLDCPDIVSCALEAEMKRKMAESGSNSGSSEQEEEGDSQPPSPLEGTSKQGFIDPYYGLVHSESCATSF